MHRHDKGMLSKNMIHNYFIRQGYKVYAEDTSQPLVDLIAVDFATGLIRWIECKTMRWRNDGTRIGNCTTDAQKRAEELAGIDIEIAEYNIENDEVVICKKLKDRIINPKLRKLIYG